MPPPRARARRRKLFVIVAESFPISYLIRACPVPRGECGSAGIYDLIVRARSKLSKSRSQRQDDPGRGEHARQVVPAGMEEKKALHAPRDLREFRGDEEGEREDESDG